MAALTGNSISSSYLGLLKTTDNAALTGTLKQLTDGAGNNLTLQASTAGMSFSGNIDFSAATVTGLPSGGGGGLELGPEPDSLRSVLTTTPAVINAGGDGGVAIGNQAVVGSAFSGINSVALGYNARALDSNDVAIGNALCDTGGGFAFGQFAQSTGSTQSIALGYNTRSQGTQSVAIGGASQAKATRSVQIGANGIVNGQDAVGIGQAGLNNTQFRNAVILGNWNASGANSFQSGFIAGADGGGFASGYQANDLIGIGRGITWGGSGCNNTIVMGLVASATNAQDSVGIGRQITISGNSTTAIGRNSQATAGNATAIGAYAQATANNAVAIGNNVVGAKADTASVNKLELTATGGSIIMKSPNGTEWTITVTDAGVLTVS